MIIRIMGEGQYQASEDLCNELNKIDNHIVTLVEEGKAEEYIKELVRLISEIKGRAEPLDPKEIVKSDIIVPPGDLSFEEAKAIFKGEGIFKD
jgi:hypothetical protein